MKLVALLVTLLACASAWIMTARPPVQALQQCASPKPPASLFMELDAELDNPLIAEDEDIMPARKCGFCMG